MHALIVPRRIAKVASLFRQYGLIGALRHLQVVGLHKAHALLDQAFRRDGGEDATRAKVELAHLTIASVHRDSGVHYLPTPWRVLDWLHDVLPKPDAGWSFVDLGCGKGRVLVSAAARPYGRVIGVEFARELAQTAAANVAAASLRRAGSIEVIEGDAATFALPLAPACIFLFNPFGPPVIDQVAENIERSYAQAPRPLVVAYLNPRHGQAFDGMAGFARMPIKGWAAAKFSVLSPYRLQLYATAEAMALLGQTEGEARAAITGIMSAGERQSR